MALGALAGAGSQQGSLAAAATSAAAGAVSGAAPSGKGALAGAVSGAAPSGKGALAGCVVSALAGGATSRNAAACSSSSSSSSSGKDNIAGCDWRRASAATFLSIAFAIARRGSKRSPQQRGQARQPGQRDGGQSSKGRPRCFRGPIQRPLRKLLCEFTEINLFVLWVLIYGAGNITNATVLPPLAADIWSLPRGPNCRRFIFKVE